MKFLLLSALLAVVPSEAFYPDGIDGPDPPNDRNGDSEYDIPHIFFQPNTDVSTIDIGSSVPSDAPSNVPTPVFRASLPSGVPSDMPSLVPSALASDEPSNVPTYVEPTDGDRIDNSPLVPENPSSSSTPVPNEISDAILPSLLTETRSSKHRFQWGSTTEGCSNDEHPPVFISCGAGGYLNQVVGTDAVCESLSNDRARCNSNLSALDEDGAFVDFQCSGVTKKHLTATAEVFPSSAESCSMKFSETTDTSGRVVTTRGGNAAVFGVLGRVCKQNNGETRLENIYDCQAGTHGMQGDISYCASGSMCGVDQACTRRGCEGDSTCQVEIGAVSMSNPDDREACSFPEYGFSLVSATFLESRLATYHEVLWTFSGEDLGCRTFTPDLTLQCANGEVKLGEPYPYCLDNGSSITCTNPFGSHDKVRETLNIKVMCLGDSYDQLELLADIPELKDEGSLCTDGSLAIHGLTIQKLCSDDQLISSPSFCVDYDDIFADENLCYSKFECMEDTCEGEEVTIPAVSAVSFSQETRYCVRAG